MKITIYFSVHQSTCMDVWSGRCVLLRCCRLSWDTSVSRSKKAVLCVCVLRSADLRAQYTHTISRLRKWSSLTVWFQASSQNSETIQTVGFIQFVLLFSHIPLLLHQVMHTTRRLAGWLRLPLKQSSRHIYYDYCCLTLSGNISLKLTYCITITLKQVCFNGSLF